MSLVRVFRKKSSVLIVLVAIALLLAPTFAVTAYNGHGPHHDNHNTNDNSNSQDNHSNDNSHNPPPNHTYPLGTVCGDALAGQYGPVTFTGHSGFRGWTVTFTVNGMDLSGGASGMVTATGGSVSGVGHGNKLASATFGNMKGTYHIVGGSMHITFVVHDLTLTAPVSLSLGTRTLPVSMSCNTLDA